ncbi:folliculin [Culicoides brevitarsis]|uniref:folliculin n=1 Tax=Culicoides brevitarsis TaxID=469753 RepID=UPI00307CAC89
MNAVIALNHFCESHGPNVVFTTTTLRETNLNEISFKNVLFERHNCPSCNSIGLETGYNSSDAETNTKFFSSQHPVLPDTVNVLKVAATRSLSCETSYNKNGGFVFFGDASGHILSHTFHLADSNARGLFKLYSITILMKDKTFLLNTEPFLSQHLEEISKELQGYADKIYEKEQSESSQRATRLNAGRITSNTKRSLMDLTGKTHIYGMLHQNFAWLLWAGARYLSESITLGTPSAPPWLGKETEEGFTMVQLDKEDFLLKQLGKLTTKEQILEEISSPRQIYQETTENFPLIIFSLLTGVGIYLVNDVLRAQNYLRVFKNLLPEALHKVFMNEFPNGAQCRVIVTEKMPENCTNCLVIEFKSDNQTEVKSFVSLPAKMPTLVTKIVKAVKEEAFTEAVLEKRIKVLVEEWKNKVQCLLKMNKNQDTTKLKKVLGLQVHDQPLINFWMTNLN